MAVTRDEVLLELARDGGGIRNRLPVQGSSHVLDRHDITFDDDHAVAHAGLGLPATWPPIWASRGDWPTR